MSENISDEELAQYIKTAGERTPLAILKVSAGKMHSVLTELQQLRRDAQQAAEDAAGEDL